jgi:hypothetical protein
MLEIVKLELEKLVKDYNYWGSELQINQEKLIMRFAFKDLGIEMLNRESLEEYYSRIIEAYKLQS